MMVTMEKRNKMPIYTYKCDNCSIRWEELGSMAENEEHECPECSLVTTERVPSWRGSEVIDKRKKVGDEVKAFIEDSKEIMKEYREELKKERG